MYFKNPDGEQRAQRDAAMLIALGNPHRYRVLNLLIEKEWAVGDLAHEVGLSQSALSQHLAKLRDLNLVKTRREAQTIFYTCQSMPVETLLQALRRMF